MRSITLLAAATVAAALSAPAYAAIDQMANSPDDYAWQTMRDRDACDNLGTEFKQEIAKSDDSKATIGHADSIAATAREDCNTGHYRAGLEAYDEALAALEAIPGKSWLDSVD